MLCLHAADSASLRGLGPVGAVGIVSALLAQTTFLPALLLVAGRAAFWPRLPRFGTSEREESRIWAGIGSRVARRPAATAVIGFRESGHPAGARSPATLNPSPPDDRTKVTSGCGPARDWRYPTSPRTGEGTSRVQQPSIDVMYSLRVLS